MTLNDLIFSLILPIDVKQIIHTMIDWSLLFWFRKYYAIKPIRPQGFPKNKVIKVYLWLVSKLI